MICTFCKNKGIPGPHNHTVRHWTLPHKPIICPNLLNNICPICKTKGHTYQYCPNQTDTIKPINISNLQNKDILIKENNNHSIKRNLEIQQTNNKIQKI
tara:strand:- start:1209 stop:1505 length:297 start_codon:yes stop_codon:yes gene_type:complete